MKDLRKTQETLTPSISKFSISGIIKWLKPFILLGVVMCVILQPARVATIIGNWITSFFGTLVRVIKIDGIESFDFLLYVTILVIISYLVNKYIKSSIIERISKQVKV